MRMKFWNSSLFLLTIWVLEPESAFQHNVYHSLMTCVALINEVRETNIPQCQAE